MKWCTRVQYRILTPPIHRALKSAVNSFKTGDETSSIASSNLSQEQFDIAKMKKELARLQEMLMEASEADKKALNMKIKELQRLGPTYRIRP